MMNAEEFPVVLFSSQDGDVRVNAVLRERTLWLTQKSMAGLFGVKSQAITKHLKNIYATGELQIAATCSKMEQVQSEGGRNVAREMVFYNLDAIIAVGYRVNSYLATQFRIWATKVLTEYITKGFVLDDNRLKKGGNPFGEDYFSEMWDSEREIIVGVPIGFKGKVQCGGGIFLLENESNELYVWRPDSGFDPQKWGYRWIWEGSSGSFFVAEDSCTGVQRAFVCGLTPVPGSDGATAITCGCISNGVQKYEIDLPGGKRIEYALSISEIGNWHGSDTPIRVLHTRCERRTRNEYADDDAFSRD